MRLLDIFYGNDNIVKAIILSDSGNEYTASYDGDSEVAWCTCPRYIFNRFRLGTCNHVLFLLDNIEYSKMKPTKRFKNFLKQQLLIMEAHIKGA